MNDETGPATRDALARARSAFLDDSHRYGCAEATFVALKDRYALPDPDDSAPAMAFNGGIAWSGGPCGAVTGAALAIGMLAARRIVDHARAKRVARGLVAELMDAFVARFGSLACADLVGMDLRAPGAHDAFLEAGTWRTRCMAQIEFVVAWAAPLTEAAKWTAAVANLEAAAGPHAT